MHTCRAPLNKPTPHPQATWQRQDAEIKELEEKIEKREKAVQRLQTKACAQILDTAKAVRVGVTVAAARGGGEG